MSAHDSPFTLALLAGGGAGTSVDVALHPLDTLKVRLQSEQGFWRAGGFRGVYRGIAASAIGSAPGAALFFSTYESGKSLLKDAHGQEHWTHHVVASSAGEMMACLVRVPTQVVVQNLQVGRYHSLGEAVSSTLRVAGIRGFYAGYGTMVMREIPFAFIQFPIYERLKQMWASNQRHETSPMQGAVCGCASGAIAGALTTPLDVATTRILLETSKDGEKKYTGTLQTLRTVAREEGAKGLFKGIEPRVFWIAIGGFMFFGAYEQSTAMLWKSGVW